MVKHYKSLQNKIMIDDGGIAYFPFDQDTEHNFCYSQMISSMLTRVGQFQVCVSDFFHLLNFGVCYREKNEKIFKIFLEHS